MPAALKTGKFCLCCKDNLEIGVNPVYKTCSVCKLASYCSKKCHEEDFESHKYFCKRVKYSREEIKEKNNIFHRYNCNLQSIVSKSRCMIKKNGQFGLQDNAFSRPAMCASMNFFEARKARQFE
jgi:hypothetical protein